MTTDNLLKFATMCDRLQLRVENGKDIWATLMLRATRIDPSELEAQCDLEEHFEDEGAYEQFLREDPNTGAYRVDLPSGPVYFIQTSGFEYFFSKDGVIPTYFEDLSEIVNETARNNCAGRLILPANSALASGSFGPEQEPVSVASDLEMIKGVDTRYRLLSKDGNVIAGALVQEGKVVTTFATMAYLGLGIEDELESRINTLLKPKPRYRPQRDTDADDFQP